LERRQNEEIILDAKGKRFFSSSSYLEYLATQPQLKPSIYLALPQSVEQHSSRASWNETSREGRRRWRAVALRIS